MPALAAALPKQKLSLACGRPRPSPLSPFWRGQTQPKPAEVQATSTLTSPHSPSRFSLGREWPPSTLSRVLRRRGQTELQRENSPANPSLPSALP